MAITYTVATNIIQVTGYIEGTSCNFTDIYNADKAGTLSIHDRNAISAVDGAAVAVDRALRPTDYVILGGTSGDLYITVTNWTNMTTATIRITGTDRDGNAQTEDIIVNANGTYNTTKWFKTVTHTQVTVFTKSDSGSFDYELIQGQWGVVSRQCVNGFCFDAKIQIGDGSTATWFKDTNKLIVFSDFTTGSAFTYILVKANAHFQLGKLLDIAEKRTRDGCMLKINNTTYGNQYLIQGDNVSEVVKLYSSLFNTQRSASYPGNYAWRNLKNVTMWHCETSGCGACGSDNVNIYDLRIAGAVYGFLLVNGTLENIEVSDISPYDAIYGQSSTVGSEWTFKSLKVFNAGYDILAGYSTKLNTLFLVNCWIDRPWHLRWDGSNTKVYRQYEFDIKVQDKDENDINGATVKIWDLNNNLVVDTTTASGVIATQTLNYGYYNQAGGDTPTMQTPHTIQISKAGYETYKKKWAIDEKTSWTIALYTPKRRFDSLEG